MNQDRRKPRPRLQSFDGQLERANLLPLGLPGVELSGVKIRECVNGRICATAEASFERSPSD